MKESYNKLIPSKYSDLYSTKIIVTRDSTILKYYIERVLNQNNLWFQYKNIADLISCK